MIATGGNMAIAKAPDDPYWRLYRQTALRRLGRPAEAVAAPADGAWPAPLFALHAGTATPEAVLAAATGEGQRSVHDVIAIEYWRCLRISVTPG